MPEEFIWLDELAKKFCSKLEVEGRKGSKREPSFSKLDSVENEFLRVDGELSSGFEATPANEVAPGSRRLKKESLGCAGTEPKRPCPRAGAGLVHSGKRGKVDCLTGFEACFAACLANNLCSSAT